MSSSTIVTKQTWLAWAAFWSVGILEKAFGDWIQPPACWAPPHRRQSSAAESHFVVTISKNSSVCAYEFMKHLLWYHFSPKDCRPLRGRSQGAHSVSEPPSLNSGDTQDHQISVRVGSHLKDCQRCDSSSFCKDNYGSLNPYKDT